MNTAEILLLTSNQLPNKSDLLLATKTTIVDGRLQAYYPPGCNHAVQQVKGSGFHGIGIGTVAGLLTTDTITATGGDPTCTVNGTLTFPADCWDIYVHRAGVLWAFWCGCNVGGTVEADASGNGHDLTALTGTTITERTDGTGTNWINERGYSVADGSQYSDNNMVVLLPENTISPVLYSLYPSTITWTDGKTLTVTFKPTVASADVVGDVQVYGPLYIRAGYLVAKDGANEAVCAATWAIGDTVIVMVQTDSDGTMRVGRG